LATFIERKKGRLRRKEKENGLGEPSNRKIG